MPAVINVPRHNLRTYPQDFQSEFSLVLCLGLPEERHLHREGESVMITNLVDIEDAKPRLACGERPYGFQISENVRLLGPACGFGADYISKHWAEAVTRKPWTRRLKSRRR